MKAQSANRMAAAAAMALMAMSVSGPAQAAGDSKSSDLEWALASTVTSTTAARGLHSGYDRPTLLVAQSSCQWQAAMAALSASNSLEAGPEPEPNGVDWQHQSAVVVALGRVPYGYSLDALEARQSQGKLLVDVRVNYESTENNLEDNNPVVVLLVNAHGNTVRALYENLALPGMPSQNSAASCGAAHAAPSLAGSDGSAGSAVTMTWGGLKSTYR